MSINRQRILTTMAVFKDPKQMKARYGITITANQIQAAERAIRSYQTMSDAELRHIDERTAMKWPYTLTEEQRYEKLMFGTVLTMTQTILWQNVRRYLSKHTDERKTNAACIAKALQDLEGFLQLNAYLGEFAENHKLIDGTDPVYLMKLFNMSYQKYMGQPDKASPDASGGNA